tara:strand:+ start:439 stop:963 length:525 start_codon:yes stop_codon:yes gene_type:complete
MKGAIFFDRDNTLIIDNGYTWKISDFAFLYDSAEALALLNTYNIPVFIVTNQSGIARGYFKEIDMHKFNLHLCKQVILKGGKIADIAFCPHHPKYPQKDLPAHCDCRKPATGMLKQLSHKWGVDLKKSVMIGDQQTDIEAGSAAGCVESYILQPSQSRVNLCNNIISNHFEDYL